MSLRVGSKCLLEGQHKCTVRYVGATSFGSGTWYGVEMADPRLGQNDGNVDGVRYFATVGGASSASFVRRGRLHLGQSSRDTGALGSGSSARASSVPGPLDLASLGGQNTSRITFPRDSVSNPTSPTRSSGRRNRAKSSVDPRQIQQAMEETRKEKRLQKRSRNRTSLSFAPMATSPEGSRPGSADSEVQGKSAAHHAREAEMRGEIMRLQKEHMKTLMVENKHLTETNDTLVAHIAEIEAKHATVTIENEHVEHHVLGGEGDESYHAIVSERDLAIHKLTLLAQEFETYKNTVANKQGPVTIGDRMSKGAAGGPEGAGPDGGGGDEESYGEGVMDAEDAWVEIQRLQAENDVLRRHVQGQEVDLSDMFPNHDKLPDTSAAEVQRLNAEISMLNGQLVAARASASSGKSPTRVSFGGPGMVPSASSAEVAALEQRASVAEGRVSNLTKLVQQMMLQKLPASMTDAVGRAVEAPSPDRADALHSIFETEGFSWDDLDIAVAQQNQELDRALEEESMLRDGTARLAAGGLNVTESFAAMRSRLTGRLQKVLHTSNSIRIRSQALTPMKPGTRSASTSPTHRGGGDLARSPSSESDLRRLRFPDMNTSLRRYNMTTPKGSAAGLRMPASGY